MRIVEADEDTLVRYLHLYQGCSIVEKNSMFFLLLKNYMWSLKPCRFKDRLRGELIVLHRTLHDDDAVPRLVRNVCGPQNGLRAPKLNEAATLRDVVDTVTFLARQRDHKVRACLRLANAMHLAGLCPLMCYSFGRWQLSENTTVRQVRELIEFSVMTLYRVAARDSTSDAAERVLINSDGSNSDIYASPDRLRVYKVPKNMAAFEFLSEQEYGIAKFLRSTALAPYVAADYAYDPARRVISHELIEGRTGEHYLLPDTGLTAQQVRSLEVFYYRHRSLYNMVLLDIHPGNFIWNERAACWTLIDLGAIPTIGREYYEHETYSDYLFHIWQQRRHYMAQHPIRSLDFSIDLNV
ncbi:hypothetical protein ACQPW1_02175 [Nocardia sp. CA-128927]|uniref:hypothetical protein n=1 Tax=Nocardia sp. CA-128927 TaxID=3239975 RepID=UPI003D9887E7